MKKYEDIKPVSRDHNNFASVPQLEPGIRRLKPGNVLILNQTYAGHAVLQREFAVEDVDTIDALFRDMDFDVRIPTNARGQRIVDFTEDVSTSIPNEGLSCQTAQKIRCE